MITPDEFMEAAEKVDLGVGKVRPGAYGDGVNIYLADDPVPSTTLWWPADDRDQFIWGHSFEYNAPTDTGADTLVQMVLDSKIARRHIAAPEATDDV